MPHLQQISCPDCRSEMTLGEATSGTSGYDISTFKCHQCPYTLTTAVELGDPMACAIINGWIEGELRAPN